MTGRATDGIGDDLIERDAVLESGEPRAACGGEPGHLGGVAVVALLLGMGESGEEGEIAAVILQLRKIGREFVVQTPLGREEMGTMKSEGRAHRDEAFRRHGRGGPREGGCHRLQERQSEHRAADSSQKMPATEGFPGGEMGCFHGKNLILILILRRCPW